MRQNLLACFYIVFCALALRCMVEFLNQYGSLLVYLLVSYGIVALAYNFYHNFHFPEDDP